MTIEARSSEEVLVAWEKRRWANGEAPSLYELLAQGYKDTVGLAGVLRIRPVVVDADVLLKETMAVVKRPGRIKLFDESCSGPLRIFVAETVPGEVDRNLTRVCLEAGVDEASARDAWTKWRSHLRVVATPEVIPAEAQMAPPSDVPTAVLALILGPELTWSNDRGLQQRGLAIRYPTLSSTAIAEVGDTELGVHITVRVSSETVEAAVTATRRAWTAVGPTGQLLLVFGLGIALGYTIARREEVVARLRVALPAVERISQMLSDGYTSYVEAVKDLPPAPVISASIPLEYQVARVLAYAAIPQTVPEIVERLRFHSITASVDEVRTVLGSSPIFAKTGRWYWQLGA